MVPENDALGREIELKYALPDERALAALSRQLLGADEPPPAPVRQVNHFFDTPGLALRRAQLALRLREEGGRFLVTAKGPAEGDTQDGALTARAEEEVEIDGSEARAILAGETSALALLVERRAGASAFLKSIELALADEALQHVGSFENARTRIGRTFEARDRAGTVELLFELDRTSFPGERVDCEVEIEVRTRADAERARWVVEGLLEKAGVSWSAATSKAQRFFEALEER